MSYASAPFASTSFAGLPVSRSGFFFPEETLGIGVHRRSMTYTGSASFFAIYWHMENLIEGQHEVKIYSHNDPHETPQLQATIGPSFDSETIIGAAQFIVVDLEMFADRSSIEVTITGKEYFQ